MKKKKYPILEFDSDRRAVIEPSCWISQQEMPEYCVLNFYQDVINKLKKEKKLKFIKNYMTLMGMHPLYGMKYKGREIAVIQPGITAPLAAGLFEEIIATGGRKFMACGSCGVLDGSVERGKIIIPVSAIRDEGVSYHYVQPSREIKMDKNVVCKIEKILKLKKVPYIKAKTWTTDAFYRETKEKIGLRKKEGCLVVEMECSALFAVARFRNRTFGQILSAEDDVSGDNWNHRHSHKIANHREELFWLAVECCLVL